MYGLGPISYISVTKGNDMVATSLKNTKGPFPNLNTVIMVEEVLSSMDESVISVADLKRKLPRKVNHNKLKILTIMILLELRGSLPLHLQIISVSMLEIIFIHIMSTIT